MKRVVLVVWLIIVLVGLRPHVAVAQPSSAITPDNVTELRRVAGTVPGTFVTFLGDHGERFITRTERSLIVWHRLGEGVFLPERTIHLSLNAVEPFYSLRIEAVTSVRTIHGRYFVAVFTRATVPNTFDGLATIWLLDSETGHLGVLTRQVVPEYLSFYRGLQFHPTPPHDVLYRSLSNTNQIVAHPIPDTSSDVTASESILLTVPSLSVTGFMMHPDGRTLLVRAEEYVYVDGWVGYQFRDVPAQVWDVTTQQVVAEVPVFSQRHVFSPDGRLLAFSGTGVWGLRVWNTQPWRERYRHAQSAAVTSLAFNHAGTLLASGLFNGSVHIHDAESGVLLLLLSQQFPMGITSVGFSPDDQWFVVSGSRVAPAGSRYSLRRETSFYRVWAG